MSTPSGTPDNLRRCLGDVERIPPDLRHVRREEQHERERFTNANHAGMSKPAIVTSVSVCAPTTPLIWSVPAKTTTDIAVTMSGISYARFCATARSPPRSEYLLFDA